MGCLGYASQDDCKGLFTGLFWAVMMVGTYYLLQTYFDVDLKSLFLEIPFSEYLSLQIIMVIYWVLPTAIIEEWFWRNYIWGVLYNDRFLEKLWIALTWASMYSMSLLYHSGWIPCIAFCVISGVVGYLLAPFIRYTWSYSAMIYLRMGLNLGMASCWYLSHEIF